MSDLLVWGVMPILAVATAWYLSQPLRASMTERRSLLVLMIVIPALSLLLYLNLGAQGRPDMPLAARLDTPIEELPIGAIIVKIENQLAANPNDVEGWRFLARLRQQMGFYDRAIEAWQIVAQLQGKTADISVAIAENFIAMEGGLIKEAALRAIAEAAEIDPENPRLKFLQGLSVLQQGDRDGALELWGNLMASLGVEDPLRQRLSVLIDQTMQQGTKPQVRE